MEDLDSTRVEVDEEHKQEEFRDKSSEDYETRNVESDIATNGVKETEKASEPSKQAPSTSRYFCEPNQNLILDAWKVFFYHMLPFTTIPHLINLLFLYWCYLRWGGYAFTYLYTIIVLLALSPQIYSKTFRATMREHFYRLLARYVPTAQYVVPEKPFPDGSPYIFVCHPHGRMFYSAIIFSQLHETWRATTLETGDLFLGAAGGFFYLPVLNLLFSLVGTIPVTRSNIVSKLRERNHVAILVGGVKEVLLGTEDNVDRLYLKKRKGFCKIAMEEHAGVVPVYFFNENQMFRHNSKTFLRFWERVNKYYKIGVPFFRGRFFALPMPFRRPLLIAVGEPLFAKERESVDDFHQRYMQALQELFDKYVAFSPNPNHKLIIQ